MRAFLARILLKQRGKEKAKVVEIRRREQHSDIVGEYCQSRVLNDCVLRGHVHGYIQTLACSTQDHPEIVAVFQLWKAQTWLHGT
jgi:hypothetical protein